MFFFFLLLCLEKTYSSGILSVLQIRLLHPHGSSILRYDFIPSLEPELRKKRARCLTLRRAFRVFLSLCAEIQCVRAGGGGVCRRELGYQCSRSWRGRRWGPANGR